MKNTDPRLQCSGYCLRLRESNGNYYCNTIPIPPINRSNLSPVELDQILSKLPCVSPDIRDISEETTIEMWKKKQRKIDYAKRTMWGGH
jgi:hypothetical protein